MWKRETTFSEEVRKAFQKELGDAAEKKLPKGVKPDVIKDYVRERYKNSSDGVLFREGGSHTHASVDGGVNWVPLGGRHPSRALDENTARGVIQQLDDSRMVLIQARQRKTKSLDPSQWAEEVRSLNLLENPKIYENPNEQGFYTGNILYRDPAGRYCVQKLGEKSIVLHDARKFPEGLPEKGDVVRIKYRAGVAKVSMIREKTNERGGWSR